MADFMGLMKQAAQLQSKMQALQEELEALEVEGSAGGGMVAVTLNGKGDLKGVKIDDSLLKPSEKEILEDLMVAAHADARRKAEGLLQEKMKAVTGGLPLPPGLGFGLTKLSRRLPRTAARSLPRLRGRVGEGAPQSAVLLSPSLSLPRTRGRGR